MVKDQSTLQRMSQGVDQIVSEFFSISHDKDSFVISLSVAIHSLKREGAFRISQNKDPVKRSKMTGTSKFKICFINAGFGNISIFYLYN